MLIPHLPFEVCKYCFLPDPTLKQSTIFFYLFWNHYLSPIKSLVLIHWESSRDWTFTNRRNIYTITNLVQLNVFILVSFRTLHFCFLLLSLLSWYTSVPKINYALWWHKEVCCCVACWGRSMAPYQIAIYVNLCVSVLYPL